MPAVRSYAPNGNPYVDGLLGDAAWASSELTFSFPRHAALYGTGYGYGEPGYRFALMNAAQQSAVRSALDSYASVAKLSFSEVTETWSTEATLRFAMSDAPSAAWSYLPHPTSEGGDAWFNRSSGYFTAPAKGGYAYTAVLHEFGHILGLEHPHEHYVMPSSRDSMEYAVMSYRSYVGGNERGYVNEGSGYAQSLMMYDIAAIQHVYGANYAHNSGNTVYSWSPRTGESFINGQGQGAPIGNRVFETVWDGGGVDTYSFASYSNGLVIDLRPGYWTTTSAGQLAKLRYDGSEVARGNIANALLHDGDTRSLIENAVGGRGSDAMIGNAADNTLYGRSGNDRLYSWDGNDRLLGGAGADRLHGGDGIDQANYSQAPTLNARTDAGLLIDLLLPRLNKGEAAGDVYISIENLVGTRHRDNLRGDHGPNTPYGLSGNDLIYGRNGDDTLYGGDGNDRLLGQSGIDRLFGGGGSDSFIFNSVAESSASAADTICDFEIGRDKVDLRRIDANDNVAGNQAFLFVDDRDFSSTACELRFDDGHLSGDVDGDGVADLLIAILGVEALASSDILL